MASASEPDVPSARPNFDIDSAYQGQEGVAMTLQAVAGTRIVEAFVFGSALDMVSVQDNALVSPDQVPDELPIVQDAVRQAIDPTTHALFDFRRAFDRGLAALMLGFHAQRLSLG